MPSPSFTLINNQETNPAYPCSPKTNLKLVPQRPFRHPNTETTCTKKSPQTQTESPLENPIKKTFPIPNLHPINLTKIQEIPRPKIVPRTKKHTPPQFHHPEPQTQSLRDQHSSLIAITSLEISLTRTPNSINHHYSSTPRNHILNLLTSPKIIRRSLT